MSILRLAAAAVVMLCCAAAALAQLQYQRAEFGPYQIEYGAAMSEWLPAVSLRDYGLTPQPDLGLLHVALLTGEGAVSRTVRAKVSAWRLANGGERVALELRELTINDRITYSGTFEVEQGGEITFVIEVQPAAGGEQKTVRYTEYFKAP